MMESIKMLVVLTLIAGSCGLLLAFVHNETKQQIEEMVLKYVQGPAVQSVLKGSDNDSTILKDRQKIKIDNKEITVFIGKKEGKIWSIAYESAASGFGGDLGVMVGYDIVANKLTGIGITSHKETPGVGSRVTQEIFTKKFKGKPATANFKLKKDKGEIDALTGASVSSGAASTAVTKSVKLYEDIKKKVVSL